LLKEGTTNLYHFRYITSKAKNNMKKAIRVTLIVTVLAGFFASCRSHEKCPAYGQMNKVKRHSEIRG
jgi:hypothetical protein